MVDIKDFKVFYATGGVDLDFIPCFLADESLTHG
jgi:hypothetical protein